MDLYKFYFEFFSPFKMFARAQRDGLLFVRNIIDMQLRYLNSLLGEDITEEGEEKKKGKKEAKKVDIK